MDLLSLFGANLLLARGTNMPVYGRRGNGIRVKGPEYFGTSRDASGRHKPWGQLRHSILMNGRRRRWESAEMTEYNYTATPLLGSKRSVSHHLGFNILGWVRRRTREKPLNVLDWGAGKGTALEDLWLEMLGNVNTFGYGDQKYPGMEKSKWMTFIQGKDADLFRFFKKPLFHLIFSSMGLVHYARNHSPGTTTNYLIQLAHLLQPRGMLVFSTVKQTMNGKKGTLTREWKMILEDLKEIPGFNVESQGNVIRIIRK